MLSSSIYFSTEHAIFYLANHLDTIMKQDDTHHWVSVEEHGAHLLEVCHAKETKIDKWSFTADKHQNKIRFLRADLPTLTPSCGRGQREKKFSVAHFLQYLLFIVIYSN